MPWTWLARLVFAAAIFWISRRRRQGNPAIDTTGVRRHVDTALQAGQVLARVITALTLAVSAVLLLTVAVSTLLLGPRWIGIACAALTAIFGVAAVQEVLRLRGDLHRRRHRHDLLHVVESTERDAG